MSYINDPSANVGCSLGSSVAAADDQPSVYLPFADFSSLLTWKLLCQLEMIEADTVVESNAATVSCLFWASDRQQQVTGGISKDEQP